MSVNNDLKNTKVILVMGGPGSGKATLCEKLASTYGLTYLSTGSLLKTEISMGTPSSFRLRRALMKNDLAPVTDVIRLLGNAMRARLMDSPGFVIEGFPRDREQAMAFEMQLVPCRVAIFLDVPEDERLRRLLRRGKPTDRDDVIKKKLAQFRELTMPVVRHYEKAGKLVKVDGTGSHSDVFNRVRDALVHFRPKSNITKEDDDPKRALMANRVNAIKAAGGSSSSGMGFSSKSTHSKTNSTKSSHVKKDAAGKKGVKKKQQQQPPQPQHHQAKTPQAKQHHESKTPRQPPQHHQRAPIRQQQPHHQAEKRPDKQHHRPGGDRTAAASTPKAQAAAQKSAGKRSRSKADQGAALAASSPKSKAASPSGGKRKSKK